MKKTEPMRVLGEVSMAIQNPSALIAVAREQYACFVPAVDVDGMTEQEARAVAYLTADELRTHPRYVTPEQAVPDGAAAALVIIRTALGDAGAMVESSRAKILTGESDLYWFGSASWYARQPANRRLRRATRSPRRRKGR